MKKLAARPLASQIELKILFWNIHGLTKTKIYETSNYFKQFSVIMLAETFVEEKNLKKLEVHLPQQHK